MKENCESDVWHLRYGHLNIKGLQLLGNKEMVVGLPKIIKQSLERFRLFIIGAC